MTITKRARWGSDGLIIIADDFKSADLFTGVQDCKKELKYWTAKNFKEHKKFDEKNIELIKQKWTYDGKVEAEFIDPRLTQESLNNGD